MASLSSNYKGSTAGVSKYGQKEQLSVSQRVRIWVIFGAAATFAYVGLLSQHGVNLWRRDYFQFFPVFLICIGSLTVDHLRHSDTGPPNTWRIGPTSFLLSIPFLIVAVLFSSPWLAAVSFCLLGDGLLCGQPNARRVWRLLCVLLPMPLGYDRLLVQKLQMIASRQASAILDTIGVTHLMRGNVLELPGKKFFVEEACSGVSSIYLLVATTLFFIVLHRTRLIRVIPLLISVLWWAVLGNVMRIAVIALFWQKWNVDLSSGWRHEVVGLAVLGFAFLMIVLTAQFLEGLLVPVGKGDAVKENSASKRMTPTVLWNFFTIRSRLVAYGEKEKLPFGWSIRRRRLFYPLSLFLVVAGTFQYSLSYAASFVRVTVPESSTAQTDDHRFGRLSADLFDHTAGVITNSYELTSNRSPEEQTLWGPTTKVWELSDQQEEIVVSLSGPFSGWHDLRQAYETTGWKVVLSEPQRLAGSAADNAMSLQMVGPDDQEATLHFCSYIHSGELLPVGTDASGDALVGVFRRRLADSIWGAKPSAAWQLQMFVPRATLVTEPSFGADTQRFDKILRAVMAGWRSTP